MADIVDQDRWGICGFVSVLNGLRAAHKLTKWTDGKSSELSLPEIQTRLYAEIVTYLKYLVFTKSPLVAQIEEISSICSPSGTPKRNIDQIVRFIEGRLREIATNGGSESSIQKQMQALIQGEGDNSITVAMTPDSLVDYMTWAGVKNAVNAKLETTMNTSDNLLTHKNCIIGVGGKVDAKAKYNGLQHWIYVDKEGVLNNWGDKTPLKSGTSGVDLFGDWATFITHVIKMPD